ncbi:MAG: hypothetical protein AB7S36_13250 [Planctomycetota bacterium]
MGFATVDQAIAGLNSFRTRSSAIHDLIRRGPEARERVRALLDSKEPSLVWCAIRLLGDIGEKSDGERIATFVYEPEYAQVSQDALERLGIGIPSRVARGGGHRSANLTDEQLLRSAIAGASGVKIEKLDEGFRVLVPVGSERRELTVIFPRDTEDGALVTVFSDIGVPADAAFFERVLKLNAKLPDGAVGIQSINGEPRFVMTDTHLRETLDPPELGKSIFGLARYSTRIAHRITTAPDRAQ